jgi:hypothetical protein
MQDDSKTLDAEELFDLHNLKWLAHWTTPKIFFELKAKVSRLHISHAPL